MMKPVLAACAALLLTATSASANGYWQDGTYYSYPATTTSTYVAPTYTAPSHTGVVGSVGPVEYGTYTVPSSTRTYVAPSTVYTRPVYGTPTTTYRPTYIAPAYAPLPQYDGRDQVRKRLNRQRDRIERALERGDLRRGEERRLRQGLREIRRTFRAYRDNDGYIGRHEEAALMAMLDRNGQRIRRLANNTRVAGPRNGYYAY